MTGTGSNHSYVLDVDYPSQFIHQQMPAMLSYVAALDGHLPPDPNQPYDYCELGCGTGETLNVLAAANPDARFVGVDLNARHIQQCVKVAKEAGLDNVRYINASFDALDEYELPQFDFVTTHGTWSWLPPSAVSSITRFLDGHLKSGGLFYVEFLTLPGKAAIEPVWHLMRELAAASGLSAAARASAGIDILLRICEKDARFFMKNEPAASVIRHWKSKLKEHPLRIAQLAHQALAKHWTPRYITEVAEELGKVGLKYAGMTELPYNDFDLCVNEDQRCLFEGIEDPILVELLKDYIHNRHGRADVFVRSLTREPESAAAFLLGNLCLIPEMGNMAPGLRVQRPDGSYIELEDPAYASILRAVSAGNHRLSRIRQEMVLKDLCESDFLRAIHRLIATGLCSFTFREPYRLAAAGRESRFEVANAFNRVQCARANTALLPVVFASPVLGGGTRLINPLAVQLLEYALTPDSAETAVRACQAMRQNASRQHPTGRELSVAQIQGLLTDARHNLLPYLLVMGVLQPEADA